MNPPDTIAHFMPYTLMAAPPPRFVPWFRMRRGNTRTQKTVRREVRRRSNLPKAIQKRLGFKCH